VPDAGRLEITGFLRGAVQCSIFEPKKWAVFSGLSKI
jgi:hypothetical protein